MTLELESSGVGGFHADGSYRSDRRWHDLGTTVGLNEQTTIVGFELGAFERWRSVGRRLDVRSRRQLSMSSGTTG